MRTLLSIPTEQDGLMLTQATQADRLEWAIAHRAEPHPLRPDQPGAPDYVSYTRNASIWERHSQWTDFSIRHSDVAVGFIALYPDEPLSDQNRGDVEVGYFVGVEHQNRGYATAALRALSRYAIENLEYDAIYAKIGNDNEASQAVARNAGFVATDQLTYSQIFTYSNAMSAK